MLSRRNVLLGAAAAGVASQPMVGRAQGRTVSGWPARTVQVISPSGAGGPNDNFRLYAEQMRDVFGQSFILENLPGASGAIGAQRVLRAPADGQTLLLASNSQVVVAPLVVANFAVDVQQFVPIAMLFRFRFLLLVNPDLQIKTLPELIAYARQNPGKLNFGSPGIGTGGHLVSEFFAKQAGVEAVHIPYKTTTQQMMDTVSGTLQFTFDSIGNSAGMVETKKLVPLAVTGTTRAESAPDIPTFRELGLPGFENLFISLGLLAPKGTPPAIIEALNGEISRLNGAGAIPARLRSLAYEVAPGSPQDYAASLAADRETWSHVVDQTGIRIRT